MPTNDHTVPQAYLKRFAQRRRNRGAFIVARPVDNPEAAFHTNVRNIAAERDFYWASAPSGGEHHEMEHLLGRIEAAAIPAFNAVLDHHSLALIQDWPLRRELRERLAWWMAAQLLRTTRQRARLVHGLGINPQLDPPGPVAAAVARDIHVAFIATQVAQLAYILVQRPWGLGFSDACLLTSDVPVVVVNNHDSDDQVAAAAVYSLLLPLDPHRFLFLPNFVLQEEDWRKAVDHRIKLDGAMGYVLSQMIRDAADRHTFHHPEHPPPPNLHDDTPRLPRAWEGEDPALAPEYYLSYGVLNPDHAVERRWLTEHLQPRPRQQHPENPEPAGDREPTFD